MRLKKVEFRELGGAANAPSLKDARSLAPLPDRTEVVKYLSSAPPFVACPGVEGDVLDPSVRTAGPSHILTDGEWEWPAVLAYYVAKYNIGLPQDFWITYGLAIVFPLRTRRSIIIASHQSPRGAAHNLCLASCPIKKSLVHLALSIKSIACGLRRGP